MAHTNKSLYLMKLGRIEEAEEEKSNAAVKSFSYFGEEAKKKKEDEKKVKALKKQMKIDEEVKVSTFAGKQVFVVDSDTYHQCRLGKKQYARFEI